MGHMHGRSLSQALATSRPHDGEARPPLGLYRRLARMRHPVSFIRKSAKMNARQGSMQRFCG
eukprot:scaffold2075_cov444-Prasinococcus_capsulatus_cf.AAC.6